MRTRADYVEWILSRSTTDDKKDDDSDTSKSSIGGGQGKNSLGTHMS